ncbi:MAG: UDP-N-acetylmuramoyl-L-alanine--D-glutamate ligase [Rickettsiaceae bacterium]|nr:UDP-N-acetylmuramoyl-L-alanine--D-glutamate ligase [Rickettsiaceae bacterium]
MTELGKKISKFKKIAILGLGITGKSAYNFFTKFGVKTVCWDDSETALERFKVEYTNAHVMNPSNWDGVSHIVVSPGISLYAPNVHLAAKYALHHKVPIMSTIEIFWNLVSKNTKFIGVTGTNGKSTTTSLIYHILIESGVKAAIGGNIGLDPLSLPLDKDVYVLELSSYQLEMLKNCRANFAVLLNITPDHLEKYGNIENYINAKRRIFAGSTNDDFRIIGLDSEISSAIYQELKQKNLNVIGISGHNIGLKDTISLEEDILHDRIFDQKYIVPHNIYLRGRHNRENTCAAYAVCRIYGVLPDSIMKSISSFKGLAHRIEYLGKKNNIDFYNDSKATSAESARVALELIKNIYWLAGGLPKTDGITNLSNSLYNVKKAYLYGTAAENFGNSLEGLLEYEKFIDLEQAFFKAYKDASKESEASILLSPACASFDQFKNFEERGDFFKLLFKNISKH